MRAAFIAMGILVVGVLVLMIMGWPKRLRRGDQGWGNQVSGGPWDDDGPYL